jgi:hypothetical protein
MKGWIQRAFLKLQNAARNLLDAQSDGIAVHLALRGQSLQHQQIEGALKAVVGVLVDLPSYSWLQESVRQSVPRVKRKWCVYCDLAFKRAMAWRAARTMGRSSSAYCHAARKS